jgi:Protein of unknown function (DUF2911)/Protein of unknown function (DUF3347)
MRKILIINLLCVFGFMMQAQEQLSRKPPKSPEAAFTQQFGDSEIQVAYARPLARGRKIFGGLVPFDSLWRTGASDCTTLKLKEEVVIGDKKIGIGKYALFTIPRADEWTIILNSDVTLHGTNGYDTQKDVHRFKVKPMKSDRFYETFTIEINDINANGEGFLNLIWENTIVKIPLNPMATVAEKPVIVAKETPIAATENTTKPNVEVKNTEGVTKTETAPKMDNHAGMNMNQTTDIKAQFASVLSAYFGLKDALTNDNSKVAATNAKALKAALTKIETKNWTSKQRNTFEPLANKMETNAQRIADNAANIEQQRAHFDSLSDNLFSVTKTLKINSETVYRQFCPMANDGKGAYWLSKENKVKNPYYGKSMLTCGSVKETLK